MGPAIDPIEIVSRVQKHNSFQAIFYYRLLALCTRRVLLTEAELTGSTPVGRAVTA